MSINNIISKENNLTLRFYKNTDYPENEVGISALKAIEEGFKARDQFKLRALSSSSRGIEMVVKGQFKVDQLLDLYTPQDIRSGLSQDQKKEIKEFFRRLDKQELCTFLAYMSRLKRLSTKEIEALQSGMWDDSIYQNKEIEKYALQAFIYGKIDRFRLSEILIFLAARSSPGQKTLQIYRNNLRNEEAVQILKSSLKMYYSDREIEQFLEEISHLPPEKTQIYSIPVSKEKVVSVVRGLIEINKKFLIDESKEDRQIVLTPYLMLALLRIKFGKQTMFPNLVLGASVAAENFKKENERDVLVPSTLFPRSTPVEADGYSANALEFYHHDIAYHLLLESANPDRLFWIRVAEIFDPSNPLAPFRSKKWYTRLLDRDFSGYLRNFGDQKEGFKKTLFTLRAYLLDPTFIKELNLPADAVRKFEATIYK